MEFGALFKTANTIVKWSNLILTLSLSERLENWKPMLNRELLSSQRSNVCKKIKIINLSNLLKNKLLTTKYNKLLYHNRLLQPQQPLLQQLPLLLQHLQHPFLNQLNIINSILKQQLMVKQVLFLNKIN